MAIFQLLNVFIDVKVQFSFHFTKVSLYLEKYIYILKECLIVCKGICFSLVLQTCHHSTRSMLQLTTEAASCISILESQHNNMKSTVHIPSLSLCYRLEMNEPRSLQSYLQGSVIKQRMGNYAKIMEEKDRKGEAEQRPTCFWGWVGVVTFWDCSF